MKRWLSKRLSVVQVPFRSFNPRHLEAACPITPPCHSPVPPSHGDGMGPGALRQRLALPSCTEPRRVTGHAYDHGDLLAPSLGASWGRTASL